MPGLSPGMPGKKVTYGVLVIGPFAADFQFISISSF